jgi:3-hydroxyisobutyrate dehydrogenase
MFCGFYVQDATDKIFCCSPDSRPTTSMRLTPLTMSQTRNKLSSPLLISTLHGIPHLSFRDNKNHSEALAKVLLFLCRRNNMAKRLGFIGLGNMGSRLAANIHTDQGNLTVWDRTLVTAQKRAPKGASVVDTIDALVGACDVIFLSVSDDEADSEVVKQIVSQDLKRKIIIDFSTISPDVSAQLADSVRSKDGEMLDVGVSGSTPQVESRSLVILIGGDEKIYKACEAYIAPLGSATYYMGPSGNGLTMKLCINALLGIGVQAIAEALILGERSGLDRGRIIEVLSSTVVVSPSQKIKLELAKNGDYSQVAFALRLMYKDLGLILDQAQTVAAPMPITAASRQIAAVGIAEGKEVDFAAVIGISERMANI